MNIFILLILTLIFTLFEAVNCEYFKESCIEDLVVQKGKNFTINCTLKSNNIHHEANNYINSSNIYFSHLNQSLFNLTIISNETASLQITDADLSDSGSYKCFVKTNYSSALLCSTNVLIGEPPKKIKDESFHCESYNFRNLTCKWRPNNLDDLTKVKYELSMFPYGMWPYGLFPCAVKLNNTGCQWRIDTNPPYLLSPPKYIFLLESENKFGKTSQKFFYDHFEMITPAKPQEFQNLYTSATSVYLQWEAPEYIEHDDYARSQLQYQLKVKQLRRDEESETSILDIGNKESYTITNLTPYTNYEISIRCRIANGTSEEKWSKENVLLTKTKDAIPYVSPKFLTFESKGHGSERNITLLWTSIQSKHHNGDNFHYVIRYFPFDINSDYEVIEQIVPSTQTSFTFSNLGNVSYKFSIYSENSKGRCYDSSSLIVPEIHRLSRKPFKLQLKKQSSNAYNLKWQNLMYSKENVTFVVIWCLSSQFFECRESAHSMVVNSSSEIVEVNITTNTEGVYRFGVSATSLNWSSGVVWITSSEDKSDENKQSQSDLTMTRMVAFSLIFILIGIMIAFTLMCLKKSMENYRSLKNMSIKLPDGFKACQHDECNKLSQNKEFAVCVNCERFDDKKSVSSREHRLSCDSNDSAFIDVTVNGHNNTNCFT